MILIKDIMVSRLLERGNFDDKEDAIKKRCDTFQNECRPVLEKFAEKVLKVKKRICLRFYFSVL